MDNRPRYLLSQAARYVRISPTTLRSWVVGRPYFAAGTTKQFRPLIIPPDSNDSRLSFSNLIEAHVLRALRAHHDVPMADVRAALDYAERELKIRRLLLREDLKTAAGAVFLEHLGLLVNLGRSGQIAIKEVLAAHLERIQWDPSGLPSSLFPVSTAGLRGPQIVNIHPRIAFGRPHISGKGVRTQTIVERLDADESRETLMSDYGLTDAEIDEAVLYERAA
jgi:uncharacterized protein (DUF433 family)